MRRALVLLLLVGCGGTVEPAPCTTDAGFVVDAVADTGTDTADADASTACVLRCDPNAGWTCGGRIFGCADSGGGGECCDLQNAGCGCLAHIGYVCDGVPSDDAISCSKCAVRCSSSDGGTE